MNKREFIYKSQNGRCFYCGCKLDKNDFHLDHIIPKSRGGTSQGIDNYVASCPDCNLLKSNRSVDEFRKYLENIFDYSIQGRMIRKFYHVKKRKIKFYLEK